MLAVLFAFVTDRAAPPREPSGFLTVDEIGRLVLLWMRERRPRPEAGRRRLIVMAMRTADACRR